MLRLRFLHPRQPWVVEIDGPRVTLGRRPPADLVIQNDSVSRRQCELVEEDGKVLLFDSHSTSGTFVNDERLSPPGYAILPPDVVGNCQWKFHVERVATPLAPSPEQLFWLEHPADHVPALRQALIGCPTLAWLLVQHPATAEELLDDLSHHPLRDIQQAVARHPCAPLATLDRMMFSYHAEIEQNPALPLILLEDPAFGTRLLSYASARRTG
jgi:hypothetical protein